MGEAKLSLSTWADTFIDSLDTRLEAFAELIVDDAKARAPVRKVTGGRRKGVVRPFVPYSKTQRTGIYHFGKVKLTSAAINKGAERLGINLGESARIRAKAGKGPLLIRERSPRRRERRAADMVAPEKGREYTKQQQIRLAEDMAGERMTKQGFHEEIADTRPGRLRRSIYQEQTTESPRHIRYTVRADAPYARYVEFPTSRTAAQPFLLPALKNARSRLLPWMKGRQR